MLRESLKPAEENQSIKGEPKYIVTDRMHEHRVAKVFHGMWTRIFFLQRYFAQKRRKSLLVIWRRNYERKISKILYQILYM